MKAGNYNLKIRELEGFNLMAPLTYWDACKEEREETTGGCGPGAFWDWFVPDTIYGESVFLACQIHDWMYNEGLDVADKAIADETFRWNMSTIVGDGVLSQYRLTTYYLAVSKGGGLAFKQGRTPNKDETDTLSVEREWKEDWSK